jgi:predicted nucleotidyltransferase
MSWVDLLRDRLAPALNAGPPLRLAMIFGSVARGTSRADSDVDIAILPSDPDLTLTAELDLQRVLTAACGRPVDLIRLDRASSLLRWQVARDGRLLFQAGPFEAARFVAEAASEYLDFQPDFDRASALFQKRLADGALKS